MNISILQLPNTDTIVIKKVQPSNLFISTTNSIVISRDGLLFLLKSMINFGIIDRDYIIKELDARED